MNTSEYLSIIENIKSEIKAAQYRAAVHANVDMLLLYHDIGCVINEHKSWGNKFIDNLATDIRIAFPESKGYSVRNLKYMAKFAETYPDRKFVQTVSAQIPWSHNIAILEKVKDPQQRIWYIEKTAENGWSHNVLIHQIESSLYERQVLADKVTNFEHRLPSPQSELAVQTMKDPYVFDFIPFRENMREGKLTLPALYVLNMFDDEEMRKLALRIRALDASDEDIARFIEYTKVKGGIEYARQAMVDYRNKALALLPQSAGQAVKDALTAYIDYVIERDK